MDSKRSAWRQPFASDVETSQRVLDVASKKTRELDSREKTGPSSSLARNSSPQNKASILASSQITDFCDNEVREAAPGITRTQPQLRGARYAAPRQDHGLRRRAKPQPRSLSTFFVLVDDIPIEVQVCDSHSLVNFQEQLTSNPHSRMRATASHDPRSIVSPPFVAKSVDAFGA